MENATNIQQRLDALPRKLSIPFRNLLDAEQLDGETLGLILDAGELAADSSRLLGFAIGFTHLRSKGVPVADVIRMAKSQRRRINLDWSARRWKEEHDRLSRAESLAKLREENVFYELSKFERHLPPKFDGYLIRSSQRLGMEGFRQRHCVASYHNQIRDGRCAILAAFVEGRRWTVQLLADSGDDHPIRIGQLRSRHNALPDTRVIRLVHEMLGIAPHPSGGRDCREPDARFYMATLRAVLPALRVLAVESVRVHFEGSGDDGTIEWIEYHPVQPDALQTTTVEHQTRSRIFEDGRWQTVTEEITQSLDDAIRELTYDYLEETDVDWYNNEGGYGSLVIDVPRSRAEMEVSVRVVESVTEFYRENDILSGEEL